jgi:hypothetical protein
MARAFMNAARILIHSLFSVPPPLQSLKEQRLFSVAPLQSL